MIIIKQIILNESIIMPNNVFIPNESYMMSNTVFIPNEINRA